VEEEQRASGRVRHEGVMRRHAAAHRRGVARAEEDAFGAVVADSAIGRRALFWARHVGAPACGGGSGGRPWRDDADGQQSADNSGEWSDSRSRVQRVHRGWYYAVSCPNPYSWSSVAGAVKQSPLVGSTVMPPENTLDLNGAKNP